MVYRVLFIELIGSLGCSVGLLIGHGCLVELTGLLFGLWVSYVRWFGRFGTYF